MGKYIGSPWGFVRGKIGDAVGGVWKGIDWVRVRILPTQRGTLENYRLLKDGQIPPERFSYPQMNIRRAVLQVLGYIGRMNLNNWIYPIWEDLVQRRGWTMTGLNALVKRNAATLIASMDREIEFDETDNAPDITKMLVSDGDLESTPILTAEYDEATGELVITWDPTTYTNGQPADVAYAMVAKKPLLESAGRDGTWYPALFMYGPYTAPLPAPADVRSAGTITYTLPTGLSPANLTAYLFFRDVLTDLGHSASNSLQVVEPAP